MQVLQLLKNQNQTSLLLPYKLGPAVADGADGQVFELLDFPSQVMKLSVLYCWDNHLTLEKEYLRINQVLSYLLKNNVEICTPVFKYQTLLRSSRKIIGDNQDFIIYYYIMKKYNKISEDEKKVFHTLLSHEDRGLCKSYSLPEARRILTGLSLGLQFNYEQILYFYERLQTCPIIQKDLHPRNIMRDIKGNFKLIDFDRCYLRNKKLI